MIGTTTSHKPYPPCQTTLPGFQLATGNYLARFATRPEELDQILKLRYEVFNLELDEGLDASHKTGRDEDEYDAGCHHLMILTKDSGNIIGTYRMQTKDMAEQYQGFYSSTEFDLSGFHPNVLEQSIELGRACVAKDHRNGRVLYLLWRGCIKYMVENQKRYFFGCSSLTSQDPSEGIRVMNYLQTHNYVHPTLQITPQPGFECYENPVDIDDPEQVHIPTLMRLYLNYGVIVCSKPAIDRLFKMIDYLVLFDAENVDPRTRKVLFK
ncbi:MAG: GNAT family N-acetyltransferase [Kiritimatiellae bacterium]|nr:GNAT family N-acetyltransferase [Kiritimatiellia bacterium]